MTKTCTRCKEDKSISDFYLRLYKNGSQGYRATCIKCGIEVRDSWRTKNKDRDNTRNKLYNAKNAARIRGMKLTKYWPGVTWQEALKKYDIMLHAQDYKCYTCPRTYHKRRPLHVDHDHTSGIVRGLLCFACNSILGQVNDDIYRLQCLIEYIAKHKK